MFHIGAWYAESYAVYWQSLPHWTPSPMLKIALGALLLLMWLLLCWRGYRRNPNRWCFEFGTGYILWRLVYLAVRGWKLARALRQPLSPEEVGRLPRVHLSADGKRLIRLPSLAALPRLAQD